MMTVRRIAAFLLLICLLAPAAQAAEPADVTSWIPGWFMDWLEWLRDRLGAESPTNAIQKTGATVIPTG